MGYYACPGDGGSYAYSETYAYHPAGAVTQKVFALTTGYGGFASAGGVAINYTYDSAGRLATTSYPREGTSTPPTYTYTYDSMGRPLSMSDDDSLNYDGPYSGTGTVWAQNAQYDPAGRMTNLDTYMAPGFSEYFSNESRTFNVNGQLTQMTWYSTGSFSGSIQYNYSPTQNNGQITGLTRSYNYPTAASETISYTYDSLKRLTSAAAVPSGTSSTTAWTQDFSYDGFGNLTAKALTTGGSTTTTTISIDPMTNQLTMSSDLNGNMLTGAGATLTYDERNRVASALPPSGGTPIYYSYAPDNKRIHVWDFTGSLGERWYVYGARGEKIGQFTMAGPFGALVPQQTNVWFAGKIVHQSFYALFPEENAMHFDRAGSSVTEGKEYLPYGEEIASSLPWYTVTTADVNFASYMRDGRTLLDYAGQRFYSSGVNRFVSADPLASSAMAGDPGSWNRFAYVGGDPANRNDPSGMSADCTGDDCCLGDGCCYGDGTDCYDPGDGGPEDPCLQISNAMFGGLLACGSPVIPVGAPDQPVQPAQPTCTVTIYVRGVYDSTFLGSLGASHAFLDFTTSASPNIPDIFEGQQTPDGILIANGARYSQASGAGGYLPLDMQNGVPQGTPDGTESGSGVCAQLATLEADVAKVDSVSPISYGYFGPNSNSVLAYFLSTLPGGWYSLPPLWGYSSCLPGVNCATTRPTAVGPGKAPPHPTRGGPVPRRM